MLVLSRHINESITIGDDIEIVIIELRKGIVRIGIKAPREIKVMRKELPTRASITIEHVVAGKLNEGCQC